MKRDIYLQLIISTICFCYFACKNCNMIVVAINILDIGVLIAKTFLINESLAVFAFWLIKIMYNIK